MDKKENKPGSFRDGSTTNCDVMTGLEPTNPCPISDGPVVLPSELCCGTVSLIFESGSSSKLDNF